MRKALVAIAAVLLLAGVVLHGIASGWLGHDQVAGDPVAPARAAPFRERIAADQQHAAHALGAEDGKQILFGDLHVHTTFSLDAFMTSLPVAGGTGTHPPADACDFARICSGLDFWSINDHAENLTRRLWEEMIAAVRQCNAIAGDPADPDLVTYLGWEWSQIGTTPENHYGHKNVVLLDTDDAHIPARPIGARSPATRGVRLPGVPQRLALVATNGQRGHDLARFLTQFVDSPRCPDGVAERELPDDCLETAPDPRTLFAKLDDWGFRSLVIPHGTAWGIYTPAGSDWRKQLRQHDPKRQRLIEIYSGHGSSEQLPGWREVVFDEDGRARCPEPRDGYLPSCWRAGQILEESCLAAGIDADTCARRAADARQRYLDAGQAGWKTLPGQPATDWLDAGQAPRMFQPAFNFRPRSSAQYILAIRDFSDPAHPRRFDLGFIGSSDNHTARPGTGYKELARGAMTEGRGGTGVGSNPFFGSRPTASTRVTESVPFVSHGESPMQLFELERASAYMFTGGLVAVHASGRDRQSIWDALERREVYATSGRRILLWFDLVDGSADVPMGSSVRRATAPHFRVRAAGSLEQKPGCPASAEAALGAERLALVCRNECYNPGDARRPITRIEVVRIRPQIRADEPVDELVEDPWRVFPCPGDGSGCQVEFEDETFASAARDAVYYVRAIEAPDQLIHGSNPLRCETDASGRCVSIDPCGATAPAQDDCLSEGEPRAWSSPIYVDYAPD